MCSWCNFYWFLFLVMLFIIQAISWVQNSLNPLGLTLTCFLCLQSKLNIGHFLISWKWLFRLVWSKLRSSYYRPIQITTSSLLLLPPFPFVLIERSVKSWRAFGGHIKSRVRHLDLHSSSYLGQLKGCWV